MLEKHHTVDELAAALRIHRNTVIRWIKLGKIKCVRIGRAFRIPESEIIRITSTGVDDAEDLCKEEARGGT